MKARREYYSPHAQRGVCKAGNFMTVRVSRFDLLPVVQV
jgi:hypothetical protein